MHATNHQLQDLLQKYRQQNCSAEELQLLYRMLDQLANSGTPYPFVSMEEKALLKNDLWQGIVTGQQAGGEARIVPIRQRLWLAWIAVIVVIALAIVALYSVLLDRL